jgi:hypothetical protein
MVFTFRVSDLWRAGGMNDAARKQEVPFRSNGALLGLMLYFGV